MRTVEHDGDRYLLVKHSSDSSLVRDPTTGEERYLPNDELRTLDESPLAVAATHVPDATRRLLTAVHDERALGLLVVIDQFGPLSVRGLLDRYDLCEADLHGTVGELVAAGFLEEHEVDGERGYATTTVASEALEQVE